MIIIISHHVLLEKLQAVGVAGDLLCWIKDYLADRSQVTVVNGFQSETIPVKFGVPQGSVPGWVLPCFPYSATIFPT